MSIVLTKGEKLKIEQTSFSVGLGWDPINPQNKADLDCSVFLLNKNKIIPTNKHFIFYSNLSSPCMGVVHSGDDRTGENSDGGDDEQIKIDVSKLAPEIIELIFVVSIHTAHTFKDVNNSYIRFVDNTTNLEIAKFKLDESFSIEKSIEFGRLYKIDNEWKFAASGAGYSEDLGFFVEKYYSGVVVK